MEVRQGLPASEVGSQDIAVAAGAVAEAPESAGLQQLARRLEQEFWDRQGS